jgi:hypothetical protein
MGNKNQRAGFLHDKWVACVRQTSTWSHYFVLQKSMHVLDLTVDLGLVEEKMALHTAKTKHTFQSRQRPAGACLSERAKGRHYARKVDIMRGYGTKKREKKVKKKNTHTHTHTNTHSVAGEKKYWSCLFLIILPVGIKRNKK